MNNVVLFCHIEKCAGTTVTKKFTTELPFQAVDVLTKNNTITLEEIKKTKLFYPKPRVISGHSINPTTFDNFRSVYQSIKTFTILRNPCDRLISNYLHDRTRGVWDGDLDAYISIPWKQNYLLRFLGGGNPDNGYSGYKEIDLAISVKNINRSFPLVLNFLDLHIPASLEKKNSFQQNKSQIPSDISVENGIKVGSYSISHKTHAKMIKLNARDIEFYQEALDEEEALLKQLSSQIAIQHINAPKSTKTLERMHWIYRNGIYKPFLLGKLGYHSLPRNALSPDLTRLTNAF